MRMRLAIRLVRRCRISVALLLLLVGEPLLAAAQPLRRKFVRDFEKKTSCDEWVDLSGVLGREAHIDTAHGRSLGVPVQFPSVAQVWRGSREHPRRLVLHKADQNAAALILNRFQFDVYLPPASLPEGIRVQARMLLKNKDGLWFEALGDRLQGRDPACDDAWVSASALQPGWNTIRVDLSEESVDCRPRGHALRWSRFFLSQVVALGFSFHGDKPFAGQVCVDNITTWSAADDAFAPLRVIHFDPGVKTVPQYGLAEFSFQINRPVLNPFAQKEVDIVAHFTSPGGGAAIQVPAFYYQPYRRAKGVDAKGRSIADAYTPVGAGFFKVRFTPRLAGAYSYHITVTYRSPVTHKKETVTIAPRTMQVTARPHRGFVRISKSDPRCFEFESGEYFFPLGHSFRSPQDARHVETILKRHFQDKPIPADRGLRAYEDMLPRMQAAGVNSFEVWMASWWLGIEWTGLWKNYHGVGVYNMEHAWKLDALLDLADRYDQYVHLVIDNHGKASQDRLPGQRGKGQVDHEWEHSPYSTLRARDERSWVARDGGFLRTALELFRNEQAKMHYRDKLRYIAARWGWCTRIYGIELWSELDLIGNRLGRHRDVYASRHVHNWHREMSGWLRQQDHGNHLITTHYSGDYTWIDRVMAGLSEISYIVCDAYHSPKQHLLDMLTKTEAVCLSYNKPFQVTEFGGDWNASNIEGLDGDLYAGLWWGWMSRSAGVPMYWWFEYIDLVDHYKAFTGLQRFIQGEDKRRAEGEPPLRTNWPMQLGSAAEAHKPLHWQSLSDGSVFYAYVYNRAQIRHLPREASRRASHEGVRFKILNIKPGPYAVEVWDCWTGTVLQKTTLAPDATGTLTIPLPRFVVQVALKVRRIEKEVNPASVASAQKTGQILSRTEEAKKEKQQAMEKSKNNRVK